MKENALGGFLLFGQLIEPIALLMIAALANSGLRKMSSRNQRLAARLARGVF
jgi:hypothetical protein